MAKKKLAKVQDIPGMKIYSGPYGLEMYTTDKRFSRGSDWLELMIEAKMTGLFHAFLRERISKIVKSLKVRESKTTFVSILGV